MDFKEIITEERQKRITNKKCIKMYKNVWEFRYCIEVLGNKGFERLLLKKNKYDLGRSRFSY
jgi:hypothetical protein